MKNKTIFYILLSLLLVCNSLSASALLTDGLLSFYNLNGDYLDSTGSYNGTGSGVSSVSGIIGTAYNFTTGSSYITTTNRGTISNLTFSAWIKKNVLTGVYQKTIVGSQKADASVWYRMTMGYDASYKDSLSCEISRTLSAYRTRSSSINITDNNWHMVTCVLSGNEIIVYIDGVDRNGTYTSTASNILTPKDTTTDYDIGRIGGADVYYFNGSIDAVGIWGRDLSASEVSDLYNAGLGLEYPFTTGAENKTINFISQNPADLTASSLFSTNFMNITYNVSNITGLSYTFLNYTITTNPQRCAFYLNGSCYQQGNSFINKLSSNNNLSSMQSYILNDNAVYPATYNINESLIETTTHDLKTFSSNNDYLLIPLKNISNITSYNIFELFINSSSIAEIYYCNNSYNTGSVVSDPNCILFSSFQSTSFNHSHNRSFHNVFALPIDTTTGKIGSVQVTPSSKFIIRHAGIIGSVNISCGAYTSTNSGSSYSAVTYCPDSHLHQYNGNEALNYSACMVNSSGSVTCSAFRSDIIDPVFLPPTSPEITNPNSTAQIVNKLLNITFLSSIPAVNTTSISFYNISLLNSDLSFNRTIKSNNSLNLSYLWNTYSENLTIGIYYIKVEVTDDEGNKAFAISSSINITTNAELNITLKSAVTGLPIANYTLNITDIFTGANTSSSTITENISLDIVKSRNYSFLVDSPGFAYTVYNYSSINITYQNLTLNAYTSNSVNIFIYDETTGYLITENITVIITGLLEITRTTITGTLYLDNLTDGAYSLKFSGANYTLKTYTVTVADRSTQTLNAYLSTTTNNVVFTILDFDNGATLTGASFTQYRLINGSWTTIDSKMSDITGRVQMSYITGIKYRFLASLSGYTNYLFDLDPVLFSSYDVRLHKETTLTPPTTPDFTAISISYYNKTFFNNANNTLVWIITSPVGAIETYNLTITWPGGSSYDSGVNAIGEQFTNTFKILNANLTDKVILDYCYKTTTSYNKCFSYQHDIIGIYGNYSYIANKDNTYGLGIFERVLIATFIILFCVGMVVFYAGSLAGVPVGLLLMGYFVVVGFIPIWAVLPSMLIGFFIMVKGAQ